MKFIKSIYAKSLSGENNPSIYELSENECK